MKPISFKPAVKYKFVKKHNISCRTWFEFVPNEEGQMEYKQFHAWHKDRNADWKKWSKGV